MSTILIKNIVEKEFGVDITKRTRRKKYVEARAIYYGLLRDYTTFGFTRIGRSIEKDHATVLHGHRNLQDWLVVDKRIMEIYNKLESKLKQILAENPKAFTEIKETDEDYYKAKYYQLLKAFSEIKDTKDMYEAKYYKVKRKYENIKRKLNN
tara:strand:+ start:740 stop:1195 length:456 start_codon:yes stop_codon:yes gene_type:complete